MKDSAGTKALTYAPFCLLGLQTLSALSSLLGRELDLPICENDVNFCFAHSWTFWISFFGGLKRMAMTFSFLLSWMTLRTLSFPPQVDPLLPPGYLEEEQLCSH